MAKPDEIRLRVPEKLKEDLFNISKNAGVTLSALLKPKLREIADSYPATMKVELKD